MHFLRPVTLLLLIVGFCASLPAAPWEHVAPPRTRFALPPDPDEAAENWLEADTLETVQDDHLRRAVLRPTGTARVRTKEPLAPPYEVSLRVRWTADDQRTYGLSCYIGANASPRASKFAYRVIVRPDTRGNRSRLRVTLARGATLSERLVDDGSVRHLNRSATFYQRYEDISPVWDPSFRREIEAAMAPIPPPDTAWSHIRIAVRRTGVQLFKDGVFVGEYRAHDRVRGHLRLDVRDRHMRLADVAVRPLDETPGRYVPLDLSGLANAQAIAAPDGFAIPGDALPRDNPQGSVNDIPFRLPRSDRGDHVDVGASLMHYRSFTGGINMRLLWPSPHQLDAHRLMTAVPNRPYRRLWILAAGDGDATGVPRVTVRFFRPNAGFPIDAVATVPSLTAQTAPADAEAVPVGEGKTLWLLPVELDSNAIASEFRDHETLCMEFTKDVFPFRPYPDPNNFSSFQGGPPSAVRLFAATLETAPVTLFAAGNRPGSAFVSPEEAVWVATIRNHRDVALSGRLDIAATDPYGKPFAEMRRTIELLPHEERTLSFPMQTERFGLYEVATTFTVTGGIPPSLRNPVRTNGRFVQLPPDTRRTNERNSRWGLWTWHGGHGTNPNPAENGYLLRAAGARGVGPREAEQRHRWDLFARPAGLAYRPPRWVFDHLTEEDALREDALPKLEEHAQSMAEKAADHMAAHRDAGPLAYFVEDVPSIELMFGEYPKYLGEEGTDSWTEEQKDAYAGRFIASKAAFEAVREKAPKARLSLGWTHPQFQIPLLRMGFPKDLFDMIGIDFPTFMRMPEMPLRDISPNRLWLLKKEMDRLGYGDVPIVHHETYFPSSHDLALGDQVASDYTVRYGVLSLALGSTKLANCFSLHDCSDYWGNQHYGASGLVGRRPRYRPKPAFPAYATMTRLLDLVNYHHYVPTGSLTSYCVGFRNRDRNLDHDYVYALWTVRGSRTAEISFATQPTFLELVDAQGNATAASLAENATEIALSPTPVWLTSDTAIAEVNLPGKPRHSARPSGPTRSLGTLAGGWTHTGQPFPQLEENNPVLAPFYDGPMRVEKVQGRTNDGQALQVTLQAPPEERPTVDWYGVFEPEFPLPLPGRPRALGLWVRGSSSWGRVIYEVTDANGERFLSTGAPENWNGDDSKQASYFNFDGWRYVEFPLPHTKGYDGYRHHENCWYGWTDEGVVDLPLTLTKVVVTHRSHHVYVNELVEVPNRTVVLGELHAVYSEEREMTEAPVERQQAASLSIPPPDKENLPNPYEELNATAENAPAKILRFFKPPKWYDGTQIMVEIDPVDDATRGYNVYVSAYPDGTGAKRMANDKDPTVLVRRLRAEYPMYVFVTWVDQRRRESKPSEIRRLLLKDDFPNK